MQSITDRGGDLPGGIGIEIIGWQNMVAKPIIRRKKREEKKDKGIVEIE
jgi:hypothetical protein